MVWHSSAAGGGGRSSAQLIGVIPGARCSMGSYGGTESEARLGSQHGARRVEAGGPSTIAARAAVHTRAGPHRRQKIGVKRALRGVQCMRFLGLED